MMKWMILEGEELMDSLGKEIEHVLILLEELNVELYSIRRNQSKEWKNAEKKWGFGYNERAERTVNTARTSPACPRGSGKRRSDEEKVSYDQ